MLKIDRNAFLALALGMNLAACASAKPATGPASNNTTSDKAMAPTQEGGMAVAPHNECVAYSPTGECTKWEPTQECVAWSPTNECTKWEPRNE
jgi:hypothetical protein